MARHAHAFREGRIETRERILAVACELFARHGYRGTTIRMIANGSRLTDPAVYYYFPTKRVLHDALLVEPLVESPLPASTDLETAITTLINFFTSYAAKSDLVRVSFRAQISGAPTAVKLRGDIDLTYRQMIGPFFRQYYGEAAGQLEDIVTFMLSGLFWDAILRYGDNFETVVRQDGFQQRLRQILRAVLPEINGPAE